MTTALRPTDTNSTAIHEVGETMRRFSHNAKPTLSGVHFKNATGGAFGGHTTFARVSFNLAAHPAYTLEATAIRVPSKKDTVYEVTVNAGSNRRVPLTLPADKLEPFGFDVGFGKITVIFKDREGKKLLERHFVSRPPA